MALQQSTALLLMFMLMSSRGVRILFIPYHFFKHLKTYLNLVSTYEHFVHICKYKAKGHCVFKTEVVILTVCTGNISNNKTKIVWILISPHCIQYKAPADSHFLISLCLDFTEMCIEHKNALNRDKRAGNSFHILHCQKKKCSTGTAVFPKGTS